MKPPTDSCGGMHRLSKFNHRRPRRRAIPAMAPWAMFPVSRGSPSRASHQLPKQLVGRSRPVSCPAVRLPSSPCQADKVSGAGEGRNMAAVSGNNWQNWGRVALWRRIILRFQLKAAIFFGGFLQSHEGEGQGGLNRVIIFRCRCPLDSTGGASETVFGCRRHDRAEPPPVQTSKREFDSARRLKPIVNNSGITYR